MPGWCACLFAHISSPVRTKGQQPVLYRPHVSFGPFGYYFLWHCNSLLPFHLWVSQTFFSFLCPVFPRGVAAGFAAIPFFTTVVNFATIGGLEKLEFCQDVTLH